MNSCCAVLIDSVSIQKYIFSGNKLKENIGASFLVEEIYKSFLQEALEEVIKQPIDLEAWIKNPTDCRMLKDANCQFEVGYIGGGNALLFFHERKIADQFIKAWTLRLISKAPGIQTAVAVESNFYLDDNIFKNNLDDLFRKLNENKSRFTPQTIIPRHGITAECSYSGYSQDAWYQEDEKYISSASKSKLDAEPKAESRLITLIQNLENGGKFTFTNELDMLWHLRNKDSHIAIVHIDGNGMGDRVKSAATTLSSLREFSISMSNATLNTAKHLIQTIVYQSDKLLKAIELENAPKKANKTILPLRPIIIGGDDIAFVSNGRLGLYFAEIFIKNFAKQNVSDDKPISACAGIAVTKTKYPFFRGYELAEQLCRSAKDERKKRNDDGSWLDFHLAYGGFSGSLDDIRNSHYRNPSDPGKKLLMRPYKTHSPDEKSFEVLCQNSKKLKDSLPNSKIIELRKILSLGKTEGELFLKDLQIRGRCLPNVPDRAYDKQLWQDERTPYFDMIELMELYPLELINEKKEGHDEHHE